MKNIRKKIDLAFWAHPNWGIPNLMLFVCVGTLIVYVFQIIDPSNVVVSALTFNRRLILQGQIWRLLTYIFVPQSSGFWLLLLLFAYYGIGKMVENTWGTFKFNCFYFTGVLIMDIFGMILGTTASAHYLNLSLFLALATLYPDNRVLLMYIIPIKMKYLAWVYFALLIFQVIQLDFSPVFALLNYFLFFGKDCLNILPGKDRIGSRNMNFKKNGHGFHFSQNRNPDISADGKRNTTSKSSEAPAYRHKCIVCGRTDVSNPELEFRYCSKCSGYRCYCQDHIHNHAHITE